MSKKRNTPEEEPENPLSLSFLDALSCGLAATLALFLIFVVLPHGQMAKEASGHYLGDDSEESLVGFRTRSMKATPKTAPLAVYVYVAEEDVNGELKEEDLNWIVTGSGKNNWFQFFGKLEGSSDDTSTGQPTDETGDASKDTSNGSGYIFGGFTLASSMKSKNVILKIKNDKVINKLAVELIGSASLRRIIEKSNRSTNGAASGSSSAKDGVPVIMIDRNKKDNWILPQSGYVIKEETNLPSKESQ